MSMYDVIVMHSCVIRTDWVYFITTGDQFMTDIERVAATIPVAVCVLCACCVRAVCVMCACCVRAVCVVCACCVRGVCVLCACCVCVLCACCVRKNRCMRRRRV